MPQEIWAWTQICQGKPADFNVGRDYGGWLHPGKRIEWPKGRILTSSFLETILLHEPYRHAASIRGVTIVGAWFPNLINLTTVALATDLVLRRCRFDSAVNLIGLRTSRSLDFSGSTFFNVLRMNGIEIANNLVMNNGAEFEEVTLAGGKIGGQASLILSRFNQKLNMNGVELMGSLFLDSRADEWIQTGIGQYMRGYRAKFGEVDLVGAQIGGQLTMNRSIFDRLVNMESIKVQKEILMNDGAMFNGLNLRSAQIGGRLSLIGSLFKKPIKESTNTLKPAGQQNLEFSANLADVNALDSVDIGLGSTFETKLTLNAITVRKNLFLTRSRFKDVDLIAAKIDNHLNLSNSEFSGTLDMQLAKVNGNVSMNHTKVKGPMIMMMGMKIGGSLDLAAGSFPSINLTNSLVEREFSIGQKNEYGNFPAKWENGAALILRNVSVGSLQDLRSAWPERLELNRFTYSSLGGLVLDNEDEIAYRDTAWFETWLYKQKKYTPDVYEQLASVLNKIGYKEKSLDILYAGKERERSEAQGWNRTWLTMLNGVIGYGLGTRIWWVFYWVGTFVFVGFLIIFFFEGTASIEERDRGYGFPYVVAILIYSAVSLVPLINLDLQERDIVKSNGVRYYFYLHRIAGYVLTTFIIAGLAGIAK